MNEFNLKLGTEVHCKDGKCGKLAKIALDPDSLQVKELIVEAGLLLKQAHVFPLSILDYARLEEIALRLGSDELHDYPEYKESEFERPATETEQDSHTAYPVERPGASSFGGDYEPIVPTVKEKIREGISSGLNVVTKDTLIKNAESVIGKLSHVIADAESGAMTQIIGQQGLILSDQVTLPISFVTSVDDEAILLTVTDEELDTYLQAKDKQTQPTPQ